jgi:hypothetical protein
MSFALECHALSWDALKAALTQRKPELLQAIEQQQWPKLLDDTDIGRPDHHLLPYPHDEAGVHARSIPSDIRHGIDEIVEAMARKASPNQDPPEVSDNAALVFAGIVRQLGKPVGALRDDAAAVKDRDGALPVDFRAMFLDGVAGSCFKDHGLGENLAARPLFGLFHLDYLSWGGLTKQEIDGLLANYALPDSERDDEEWQAVAGSAETWLNQLVGALRNVQAAKTDLVTLYRTFQGHHRSVWEEIEHEVRGGFFHRTSRPQRPAP